MPDTRVLEICNPSDAYTLVCDDDLYATLACILLGNGKYGLSDREDNFICPIMIFGGTDEHIQEISEYQSADAAFHAADKKRLAEVLRTTLLGGFGGREEFEETIALIPEERQEQFRQIWHEKRTSMNNIGGRAIAIAKRLESMVEGEAA